MRVVFSKGLQARAHHRTWRALGIDRVIQVEQMDGGAIVHSVIAMGLHPGKTTAAWLDRGGVPLNDVWVQRSLVSALWAARIRPHHAVAITLAFVPTPLRVVDGERAGVPICRHRKNGRSAAWRLTPYDLLVANLGTVLDTMTGSRTTLAETCQSLASGGRLTVVNPFAQHCL